MSDIPGRPTRPASPEIRAFVLRVRINAARPADTAIVDLEDVQTTETWFFTSLEEAFAQIRQSSGLSGGSHGSPAKPH